MGGKSLVFPISITQAMKLVLKPGKKKHKSTLEGALMLILGFFSPLVLSLEAPGRYRFENLESTVTEILSV